MRLFVDLTILRTYMSLRLLLFCTQLKFSVQAGCTGKPD